MKEIIKNIFYSLSLIAVISFGMVSCENEDNTGYSTLKLTSPTITITPAFTNPMTLTEDGTKHKFTVTLSEPQIVDVKLFVNQIGGTADASDYTVTPTLVIPAGSTSASGVIEILSDDLKEEAETLTIQVGDQTTGNASLTPVSITFNINNLTSGDLVVGLNWDTDVMDAVGLDLTPDKVVDLRLLLINSAGEIVGEADGAAFETLTLSGATLPDGEYRIATDIFSTINAGDFNETITLDLQLDFNQVGLINDTILSFPEAMTNEFSCDSYKTVLATIKKTGSTYTIQKALDYLTPPADILAGIWTGDDTGYPSQVVTNVTDGKLGIVGLNIGWMEDFWGETVVDSSYVEVVINWCSGTISIPEQDYITTLYDGKEYPYTISGTGTFDISEEFPTLSVTYEVFQDGFSPSGWAYDNGHLDSPQFNAVLTLDPSGLESASSLKSAIIPKLKLINKPKR